MLTTTVYPTTTSEPMIDSMGLAYRMGVEDAELGVLCVPEMLFFHIDDKREYCAGYESVSGPTLTTQHFLGGNA